MTVNIDIQRTGFPVKIAGLEFWFDASLENLRRFFDVEDIAKAKVREAQDKAMHIHFPDVVERIEDVEVQTVDAALDVSKEFIAAQYDVLLGDGTFKKIYKVIPDVVALEGALEAIGIAIADKIKEMEIERQQVVENKKSEYLNKKAQKR